jgi:hypothetical protein
MTNNQLIACLNLLADLGGPPWHPFIRAIVGASQDEGYPTVSDFLRARLNGAQPRPQSDLADEM